MTSDETTFLEGSRVAWRNNNGTVIEVGAHGHQFRVRFDEEPVPRPIQLLNKSMWFYAHELQKIC